MATNKKSTSTKEVKKPFKTSKAPFKKTKPKKTKSSDSQDSLKKSFDKIKPNLPGYKKTAKIKSKTKPVVISNAEELDNFFKYIENSPITNYDMTDKLEKKLKKLVKKNINFSSREDAIDILLNCTTKTIMEFLFFCSSGNGNLACLCLDFAKDKLTGEHIKNDSFGQYVDLEEK